MKKISITLLFLSLCFLFISCPTIIKGEEGVIIGNYPDWVAIPGNEGCSCAGTSEWMDWESENGKKLLCFIPDEEINKTKSGKFRLIIFDQYIAVMLNDIDSTVIKAAYNYIGDKSDGMGIIEVYPEQKDAETAYEYDCYCKKNMSDPVSEDNKAHVLMTRIRSNGYDIGFNYQLTVADELIIDVDLKNTKNNEAVVLDKVYPWLNFSLIKQDPYTCYGFSCDCENKSVQIPAYWRLWGIDVYPGNTPVDGNSNIEKYIYYCFEGFSLRSINEETQTIQINLLDAKESDFADYMEVVRSGDVGTLTYYKLNNGIPVVVKKYTDLYCEEN